MFHLKPRYDIYDNFSLFILSIVNIKLLQIKTKNFKTLINLRTSIKKNKTGFL